ncbi:HipA family toxin-antitoxin system [Neisseria bacilliformis ATCC BAA-1200]|uniref:HipA family toxin-antitoxin system n=1 Tax=Neisseria bacilliformis ATCC BAA-1200 TaxID=888742 RepID=F2BBG7_9NEIS|nr:HipA family toxin-antitoxin system [Neisseria bacilliformis ATCC BAA-1200]
MRPSETIFSDGLTPQKGRLKTQLRRKRNNRRLPTDPIIRPPLFQTAQPCN